MKRINKNKLSNPLKKWSGFIIIHLTITQKSKIKIKSDEN